MAHIAAGRMILMRQNDNKNVPTEKLAVRKHNILAQEAMANFKYKPNPVDPQNPVQPRKGLRLESNGGYINKIRMDSVSGKPKEAKKVPLVRTHSKVFFKPAAGRKKSVAEKKFTVDVPDHVAHDMSPMDVDSPLVMIRNKMTKKPIHVQDIDAMNDPLKSSVYAQDIIEYLQNHQELSQFTLHLCANLIDKFLAKQRVLLNVVQLVGITALLLAAKYYERFPPDIVDLCRLTDDTYVPDQVLKMERCMLRKLDFDLNMPGPIVFVERFLMVNDCENKHLQTNSPINFHKELF
ncbi:CCNB2-like protein [Mya arenaria]|uniref:CCNB2-like protein n=2 Tax=Mya arenaria TaxID=6604 RepID=A0ABY7EC78_MYAAR|nr:CCNB2-like protein [Mya arenaria]